MKSPLSKAVLERIAKEKTTQEGYARSVGLSQATLSRIIDGAIPSGIPLIRILSSFEIKERQEILESLVAVHAEPAPGSANIPDEVLRIIETFTEELEEIGIYYDQSLASFRAFLLELFNLHHGRENRIKPTQEPDAAATSAKNLAKLCSELSSYDPKRVEEYTSILLKLTKHNTSIHS